MRNNIIQTFLDLVSISSPSRKEGAVAAYIKERFVALGLDVFEDDCGKQIHGESGNLIVYIKGSGKTILFDAHMDTVQPCEHVTYRIEDEVIYSNGDSILGADDKAGIAAMIELAVSIVKDQLVHPNIIMVFSVCEEDGLQGAKHLSFDELDNVDYAYILDGEGAIGTIVTQTPFGCKGTLKVIGKEAHAGVCPELGIHALKVASDAIAQVPIGRVNENLTCNIGMITGGTACNVIMGEVLMEFEARGYNHEEVESWIEHIKTIFLKTCDEAGATFHENIKFGTPGYTVAKDDEMMMQFQSICEKHCITVNKEQCGGGSNANIYRMNGVHALCIGIHMQDVHSVHEHIGEQDLYDLYKLLVIICEEIMLIKQV